MGQGASKSPSSSTQHVFTSETPVRFSQDLIDALEASPETDSTRAKDLELHIQSRVAAELARLSDSASTTLSALQDRISALPDGENLPSSSSPGSSAADHTAKAADDRTRDLGRERVQREIDALKHKLGARKKMEKDEGVESARAEVVRCLRTNDRRPLDCWEEVEAFRGEVARLEKGFLGRVLE